MEKFKYFENNKAPHKSTKDSIRLITKGAKVECLEVHVAC